MWHENRKFYAVATEICTGDPETPVLREKKMNQPPTTTADLMRYAVAAPATAVAVPPPPPVVVPPPPPAALDAAALQQRVRELEAALASSEAERERLAQRVAALEAEKKHPKPRGRMPLGATGWDLSLIHI